MQSWICLFLGALILDRRLAHVTLSAGHLDAHAASADAWRKAVVSNGLHALTQIMLQLDLSTRRSQSYHPVVSRRDAVKRRRLLKHAIPCVVANALPLLPASASDTDQQKKLVPPALAVIVTGFLIPGEQYRAYAALLEDLGMPAITVTDQSSLVKGAISLEEGARIVLEASEREIERRGLDASTPLVFVAHSRGGKVAVTAAGMSSRQVKALVLFDPVDATIYDNTTCMETLSNLNVPTAIVGSGEGGACAPLQANYATFYETLRKASTPRLLAVIPQAGHSQYLERRNKILFDVCPVGEDDDRSIRDVALTVLAAWLGTVMPNIRVAPGVGTSILRSLANAKYVKLARQVSSQTNRPSASVETATAMVVLQKRSEVFGIKSDQSSADTLAPEISARPRLQLQKAMEVCLYVLRRQSSSAEVDYTIF